MNEPLDPHAPPPGARLMNTLRWVLFAALSVLAVVAIVAWVRGRMPVPRATTAASGDVYYCPMHPSITSDRPGECPICGMSLEKRAPGTTGSSAAMGNVPRLTTVHLTPDRVQMIGIRTIVAGPGEIAPERELAGFVAPDEQRLARIQLRVAGWVESVNEVRAGDRVARGTPLLTLSSPELYQSEREFLIARAATDSMPHEHDAALLSAALTRLSVLGVPEDEIARLEKTREASARLTLRAPVTGTVLERSVVAGQSVGPDTPLLTIADLSRVWVLVDLYDRDLAFVRAGSRARFTSDALPGRTLDGVIEFVYPTVDPATRTAKARMVLDNAQGLLRPGMFGTVRVKGTGPRARIALPSEAVVNTGSERYVFLARADGHFEPRLVTVGREEGEQVEILSGLAVGDSVVASGTFLVDSESRLEAALGGMGAADAHKGHK